MQSVDWSARNIAFTIDYNYKITTIHINHYSAFIPIVDKKPLSKTAFDLWHQVKNFLQKSYSFLLLKYDLLLMRATCQTLRSWCLLFVSVIVSINNRPFLQKNSSEIPSRQYLDFKLDLLFQGFLIE